MEHLLNQILILTEQTSARALKETFISLMSDYLQSEHVCLYEIHTIRDDDGNGVRMNAVIAVDSLDHSREPLYLDNEKALQECYEQKMIVLDKDDTNGLRHIVFPIKEQDIITHLVSMRYRDSDASRNLYEYFIRIFNNQLYLINSKDQDHLTGFLNRQAYNRMINPLLFQSLRNEIYLEKRKLYTFLALMDIDYFKRINDRFGHIIGDEVLIIFSQIVRGVFRHDDILFRYGGEEFVIILKDINHEYALNVFERCRKKIEEHVFPQIGHISVSIGYTNISGNRDPLVVIDRADQALYYAKDQGRNKTCFYEELVENKKIISVDDRYNSVEFW